MRPMGLMKNQRVLWPFIAASRQPHLGHWINPSGEVIRIHNGNCPDYGDEQDQEGKHPSIGPRSNRWFPSCFRIFLQCECSNSSGERGKETSTHRSKQCSEARLEVGRGILTCCPHTPWTECVPRLDHRRRCCRRCLFRGFMPVKTRYDALQPRRRVTP